MSKRPRRMGKLRKLRPLTDDEVKCIAGLARAISDAAAYIARHRDVPEVHLGLIEITARVLRTEVAVHMRRYRYQQTRRLKRWGNAALEGSFL